MTKPNPETMGNIGDDMVLVDKEEEETTTLGNINSDMGEDEVETSEEEAIKGKTPTNGYSDESDEAEEEKEDIGLEEATFRVLVDELEQANAKYYTRIQDQVVDLLSKQSEYINLNKKFKFLYINAYREDGIKEDKATITEIITPRGQEIRKIQLRIRATAREKKKITDVNKVLIPQIMDLRQRLEIKEAEHQAAKDNYIKEEAANKEAQKRYDNLAEKVAEDVGNVTKEQVKKAEKLATICAQRTIRSAVILNVANKQMYPHKAFTRRELQNTIRQRLEKELIHNSFRSDATLTKEALKRIGVVVPIKKQKNPIQLQKELIKGLLKNEPLSLEEIHRETKREIRKEFLKSKENKKKPPSTRREEEKAKEEKENDNDSWMDGFNNAMDNQIWDPTAKKAGYNIKQGIVWNAKGERKWIRNIKSIQYIYIQTKSRKCAKNNINKKI